LKTRS